MTEHIVDLTEAFEDPFSLPCCPLCDQPVETHDPYGEFIAHGSVFLGHLFCISDARKMLNK